MSLDINSPLRVSALIVTRKKSKHPIEILNVLAHNKNKYGFPGGKLEENESPEDAIIRETEEELGVVPTNLVYKETYEALTPDGRKIKMFVFTGDVTENIAPTSEISEIHWLTYNQMIDNLNLLTPMTIEHVLPLLKSL